MRRRLLLAALILPLHARALTLAELTGADASGGIKEALLQGAKHAVELLGRTDGFLGNPAVRIPLPDGLKRIERVLRTAGMKRQVDELITSMNRAAEAAVPHAQSLLVGAVRQMSVADAKSIVGGGDDSATRYFRDKTSGELAQRFQPIVKDVTNGVRLAQQYEKLAGQAASFGLVDAKDTKVDAYVTRKALDGLFVTIADEEREIRRNPGAAAGDLARRVFGALGR